MAQGWVIDANLSRSLQAKLDAAQAALTRGNDSAAVGPLNAFMNEVDAQAAKKISSEAVALLKFNAQYLITNLH